MIESYTDSSRIDHMSLRLYVTTNPASFDTVQKGPRAPYKGAARDAPFIGAAL